MHYTQIIKRILRLSLGYIYKITVVDIMKVYN